MNLVFTQHKLNAIKEAESAVIRPHTLTLPRAKPGYSNHFQSLKH